MQSIGLALTLSLLTASLVALDLSDGRASAPEPTISAPANSLAVMPKSRLGLFVPKADIRNGVFAVGSSTGNEGLYESGDEGGDDGDDSDESPEPAATSADNDFVLI